MMSIVLVRTCAVRYDYFCSKSIFFQASVHTYSSAVQQVNSMFGDGNTIAYGAQDFFEEENGAQRRYILIAAV